MIYVFRCITSLSFVSGCCCCKVMFEVARGANVCLCCPVHRNMTHTVHVCKCERWVQLSAVRAILCRVCSSCRPQLGLGLSQRLCVRVCVCVHIAWCVWDKPSCCRGLYKCKEAVSVCFIRHTTDEGQVENPLHCKCVCACVCVEWAQKEETKIVSRGEPAPVSPLSVPDHPNEMWASCRSVNRGSGLFFFSVLLPARASFNLMFQCKFFFHMHHRVTCATWQAALCNPCVTRLLHTSEVH